MEPVTPASARTRTPAATTPASPTQREPTAAELLTRGIVLHQGELRAQEEEVTSLKARLAESQAALEQQTAVANALREDKFDSIHAADQKKENDRRANAWANLDAASKTSIERVCRDVPQPELQKQLLAKAIATHSPDNNYHHPTPSKTAPPDEKAKMALVFPVFVFDPDAELEKSNEKEAFLKQFPCTKCNSIKWAYHRWSFSVATGTSSFVITCFRTYRCSSSFCRDSRTHSEILRDLAISQPSIRFKWPEAASTERHSTNLMSDALEFYEGMLASSSNITQATVIHQRMLTNKLSVAAFQVVHHLQKSSRLTQRDRMFAVSGTQRTKMTNCAKEAAQVHSAVQLFLKSHSMKPHVIRDLITNHIESKLSEFALWAETRGIPNYRKDSLPPGAFRVILSADHTFKLAKAVRVDGKTRPFSAVFTIMNSDNEVVMQKFVKDLSFASIAPCFNALDKRLTEQLPQLAAADAPNIPFYIDNCCQYKKLILENMPRLRSKITVKLDLFHWLRRWTKRVKLNSPDGQALYANIRNIIYNGKERRIRQASDLIREFTALQDTDLWKSINGRNKEWHRVWANQMCHLSCLADPEDGCDMGLARRGTQEPYHCSLNNHVCARTSGSPPFVAATLYLHNWDLTLKAQMKIQGKENCGLHNPQFLRHYCELIRSIQLQCMDCGAQHDALKEIANKLLLFPQPSDELKAALANVTLANSFGLDDAAGGAAPDPVYAPALAKCATPRSFADFTLVSSQWLTTIGDDDLRELIPLRPFGLSVDFEAFFSELASVIGGPAETAMQGFSVGEYVTSSNLAPSLDKYNVDYDLYASEIASCLARTNDSSPFAMLVAHAAAHSAAYFSEPSLRVNLPETSKTKFEALLKTLNGSPEHNVSGFGALFGLLRALSYVTDAAIVLYAYSKAEKRSRAFLFAPPGEADSLHFVALTNAARLVPVPPSSDIENAFFSAAVPGVEDDTDESHAVQPARPQPSAEPPLAATGSRAPDGAEPPATGESGIGQITGKNQRLLHLWCVCVALFWHFTKGSGEPLGGAGIRELAFELFNCFITGPSDFCGSLVAYLHPTVRAGRVPRVEEADRINYNTNFGKSAKRGETTIRFDSSRKLPAIDLFDRGPGAVQPISPNDLVEWLVPIYDVAKRKGAIPDGYIKKYSPNVRAEAISIDFATSVDVFRALTPGMCKPRAPVPPVGGYLEFGRVRQVAHATGVTQAAPVAVAAQVGEQEADTAQVGEQEADTAQVEEQEADTAQVEAPGNGVVDPAAASDDDE